MSLKGRKAGSLFACYKAEQQAQPGLKAAQALQGVSLSRTE